MLKREIERIADLQGSLARTGPRDHILREIFYTGKHEWYKRYNFAIFGNYSRIDNKHLLGHTKLELQ